MMRLGDLARLASHHGDVAAIRELVTMFGHSKRWSPETSRSRIDGALALARWWRTVPYRPPLDCLGTHDAQGFLAWLEDEKFRPSTRRGYRRGASTLFRAIRWAHYDYAPNDPFFNLRMQRRKPTVRVPDLDYSRVSPRVARKLEILVALMRLGLSLPQACFLEWRHIDLRYAEIFTGTIRATIDERALRALSTLPKGPVHGHAPALGWTPDTARKHVKSAKRP